MGKKERENDIFLVEYQKIYGKLKQLQSSWLLSQLQRSRHQHSSE